MGAAGRDFHNFNVVYRDNPEYRVKAFTACQIPNISNRIYPTALAGTLYPEGIAIYPESELVSLIKKLKIDDVVFAYSDVSNQEVMERSALVNSAGADFVLMGARRTMLSARKPVVSIGAVRTGCGKSQTSRVVADIIARLGKRAAVVRHPMPYGDLSRQRCQRFTQLSDLDRYECTIEEREEYEMHIQQGHLLFAGVDYEEILRMAESEADVILWDGGNNDLPFYVPDLSLVLVDPHRPGHERLYYPGLANLEMADVIVIAKTGTATTEGLAEVRANIMRYHAAARVIEADSVVRVARPELVKGKRVLVVEDGPTLTHGGMAYGAGTVAAKQYGAAEIVDPAPYAIGSIRETLRTFKHLHRVLPAMGYGKEQIADLRATIEATPCDCVLVGTPFDLASVIGESRHNMVRVTYELDEKSRLEIEAIIQPFLAKHLH